MMHEILHSLLIAVVSAFGLIVLAKIILSKLIRKEPDYYEKDESKEEFEMLVKAGIIREEPAYAEAEMTEEPETGEEPEAPEAAEEPESIEEPEVPEAAEEPERIEEPEVPEAAEEPETIGESDVPEVLEASAVPAAAAEITQPRLTETPKPAVTVYRVLSTYDPVKKRAVIAEYWRADGKGDE